MRLGSDTGGTFTDLVDGDGRTTKVLSTPADPSVAVRTGLERLTAGACEVLAHGTTVATNALIERRGATVTLVTTHGFADVIEIARQDRPSLYDPFVDRPEPLVPAERRIEVGGRLDAGGVEVEALPSEVPALPDGTEAVALCLLHADLDDDHERRLEVALTRLGHDVTRSSDVSPEFREYERTSTAVVNAFLRPTCRNYLDRLDPLADDVLVMTSAGGLVPALEAARVPAGLLVSGPAGGVRAGAAAAVANGFPSAVTFDMGGTSSDVCLVRDGRPEPAAERRVEGLPVRLPSLDVQTIGAGGGSIARIDPGGALTVGPRSAGATPGPACYGRGGELATVTDANLVTGAIPAGASFPDLGVLDVAAARRALDRAGVDAAGVLEVVNANMARAVRRVTVERGVDPRDLALVAFGGAGPLHACDLATALGMGTVIVPARAGVLSAVGILGAPRHRELVRSWPAPREHRGLEEGLRQLRREAEAAVGGTVTTVVAEVDCRYEGQSHELRVPDVASFHEVHRRRNGYSDPSRAVEVVALRAAAFAEAPVDASELAPVARDAVVGPTVVVEPDCTIVVPAGWRGRVGEGGALVLERR